MLHAGRNCVGNFAVDQRSYAFHTCALCALYFQSLLSPCLFAMRQAALCICIGLEKRSLVDSRAFPFTISLSLFQLSALQKRFFHMPFLTRMPYIGSMSQSVRLTSSSFVSHRFIVQNSGLFHLALLAFFTPDCYCLCSYVENALKAGCSYVTSFTVS